MKLRDFTKEHQTWYKLLYGISVYLMLGAFLFNTPSEIFQSMIDIMLSPTLLLTDFMVVGSIGGALFNAGFMTLVYTAILQYFGTPMIGIAMTAVLNLTAFSLFGKNLFNSIWLFAGTLIYAKVYGYEFKAMTPTALFATGLAPLLSHTTFVLANNPVLGFIAGFILSLFVGFFLPILAPTTLEFHKKHSLYNNGMALGLLAMMAVSIIRAYGYDFEPGSTMMSGVNYRLVIYVLAGYVLLMLPRLIKHKGVAEYGDLIKNPGTTGTDYTHMYSKETVMFNMGLTGLVGTLYILVVGGDVNGLTLGAAFSLCAFAPSGKHIKNVLPIMIGVGLCAAITNYDISASGIVMAALFGTTIAPIAGTYGPVAGVVAGMSHLLLVTQMGRMHGNLLLYNNGLTGGVVAGILVAIFNRIELTKNTYSPAKEDN